jgi:hypothetical protein
VHEPRPAREPILSRDYKLCVGELQTGDGRRCGGSMLRVRSNEALERGGIAVVQRAELGFRLLALELEARLERKWFDDESMTVVGGRSASADEHTTSFRFAQVRIVGRKEVSVVGEQ